MQEDLAKYSAFYKHKHQGHKLDWDHALGTAILRSRFKNGEKELSVSLYQAVVLLLFNETAELSFSDIKVQTRMGSCISLPPLPPLRHFSKLIDDAELRRTLQSLACGKKRVLKKHPLGKDVNNGDTFQFNADFADSRYQVHINSIQAKETVRSIPSVCVEVLNLTAGGGVQADADDYRRGPKACAGCGNCSRDEGTEGATLRGA